MPTIENQHLNIAIFYLALHICLWMLFGFTDVIPEERRAHYIRYRSTCLLIAQLNNTEAIIIVMATYIYIPNVMTVNTNRTPIYNVLVIFIDKSRWNSINKISEVFNI